MKNFVKVIKNTILLSASIHILIIFFDAIKNLDLMRVNYFKILELNVLFPGILEWKYTHIAAFIVFMIVLGSFYYLETKKMIEK